MLQNKPDYLKSQVNGALLAFHGVCMLPQTQILLKMAVNQNPPVLTAVDSTTTLEILKIGPVYDSSQSSYYYFLEPYIDINTYTASQAQAGQIESIIPGYIGFNIANSDGHYPTGCTPTTNTGLAECPNCAAGNMLQPPCGTAVI